ncbi:MAG: succinate dehydrogenase/fumarate reductase cytochrome b subunit [Paludibacteraceae bacterium]|nr:succinate dehydrogenase/fumarate reductase cytochrome b subunit [Paludibacteraceae bacterium]MBQ3930237.1 succinate dehydrogenase/fumarate reductase cytochrome b subunit [Paludibacteraceae bacterium]
MWLFNSSVGRKFVMSITGTCLALFLLFHASMNLVAIISEEGYNMICEFLGANWYALVGTVGLAFLAVLHIVYAFILSIINYRARGKERYAVSSKSEGVEWSSMNMLVLGLIILGGLVLHLINFWAKMQLTEITGAEPFNGISPSDGVALIKYTFSKWYFVLPYVIWLGALWFHLTHGIWSAMQTFGWSNNIWLPRIKCISNIISTLIVLMFASVLVYYYVASLCM